MVLTKEFAAKGAAILGSAGAGGTGLYYGGHYMSGLSENGTSLRNFVEARKDNYVKFKVTRIMDNEEKDLTSAMVLEQPQSIDGFDVNFKDVNSFVVKAVSGARKNANELSAQSSETSIAAEAAISCSLKFEVEGNRNNVTTIKDNYKGQL